MSATTVPALSRPITLGVDRIDGTTQLTVIGKSDEPHEAEYRLEVESGGPGNTNRVNQAGRARLTPRRQTTLVRLNIGTQPGKWSALLIVTSVDGMQYTQELSSDVA